MSEQIATNVSKPKTDAEYELAIDHMIAETNRIREQMATDRQEIESLRAETRIILDRMRSS